MMTYPKRILILILFTGSFLSFSAAQQKTVSPGTGFKTEKDSLILLKKSLTAKKEILKNQVDSLKIVSGKLGKKLDKAQKQLFGLKRKLFGEKYGSTLGARVLNGQVWKGMTSEMMKDGWGKPDRVHKNVYKWGVFAQWYYGDITYFFKNGKLIDWEEKKKDK